MIDQDGNAVLNNSRARSGLDKEDEGRQVSTLLYCLGEEAHDVLTSTSISAKDRKKY